MKNNLMNYAYALFAPIKNSSDKQKVYLNNVKLINEIISLDKMQKFIKENFFNKKMIKKFFNDICTTLKIDNYIIYWLWVIIDNSDLGYFRKIFHASEQYYLTINNFISIDIFSSFTLSKYDINSISLFFKKLLKREIFLNIHYDQNLLCGIKIKFLNKTYDNSIKEKLNILKNKLLSQNYECD